jgi:hypothetical protein
MRAEVRELGDGLDRRFQPHARQEDEVLVGPG